MGCPRMLFRVAVGMWRAWRGIAAGDGRVFGHLVTVHRKVRHGACIKFLMAMNGIEMCFVGKGLEYVAADVLLCSWQKPESLCNAEMQWKACKCWITGNHTYQRTENGKKFLRW